MNPVRTGWLVVAALAAAICGHAHAGPRDAFGVELFGRLPAGVSGAFSFEDATALRRSDAGRAILGWMDEHDTMADTRRAWGLLSERLGVDGVEAFDALLGGNTVLAFGHRDETAAPDWIVLAAVDSAMDVRLVQRTRAVPRKIAHGRAILGLEEESFLLATLPPLRDGRRVLALAPAGAEWLLLRTLAVSAGKLEPLDGAVLRTAPTEAVVRGFWMPAGAAGVFGDVERWFWAADERVQPLAVWATIDGATVKIGLCPATGGRVEGPPTTPPAEGVLLDVVGPGSAIVSGVLERAGLRGLVPQGVRVTRRTGELVVRRGPDGVDLGARLPVEGPVEHAMGMQEPPVGEIGQVRVRELSETRASRAIFGPKAQAAWTMLTRTPPGAELLLAVSSGPPRPGAAGGEPKAAAVHIVGQAIERPAPTTRGLHGAARPRELWSLLSTTTDATEAEPAAGRGMASAWALLERASWAVEVLSGVVRGRIVLELRAGATK